MAQSFMSQLHREDADPQLVDGEGLGRVFPGEEGSELPASGLCVTPPKICGPVMLV